MATGRKKVYAPGTMTVADVFAVVKQTIIDDGFGFTINESTPGDARDLLDFSCPNSRTGMEEDAPHFVLYLQHDSNGPGSGVDRFQVGTVWGGMNVDSAGVIVQPSINWIGGPGYANAISGNTKSTTGTYTMWAYANYSTGHWWFMLTLEEPAAVKPYYVGFAGGFLSRRPHDEREPGVRSNSILCLKDGEAYTAFILGTDGSNIASEPYLDLITPIGRPIPRKLNATNPAATPKRVVNIYPIDYSGDEFAPGIVFGELEGFMWATDGFDHASYPVPFMICLNTTAGNFVLEAVESFAVLT